jgi:hypothetical protein
LGPAFIILGCSFLVVALTGCVVFNYAVIDCSEHPDDARFQAKANNDRVLNKFLSQLKTGLGSQLTYMAGSNNQ